MHRVLYINDFPLATDPFLDPPVAHPGRPPGTGLTRPGANPGPPEAHLAHLQLRNKVGPKNKVGDTKVRWGPRAKLTS